MATQSSGAFATHVLEGFERLLALPVSLVGLAFYRSWIALLTNQHFFAGLNNQVHDMALAAVLVAMAWAADRLSPLYRRRWAVAGAPLLAVGVSGVVIVVVLADVDATVVAPVCAVVAAGASALFILLWCELYCALSLSQVALALSLSMIGAEAFDFLLDGMCESYRLGALVVLPVLSICCLLRVRMLVKREVATRPAVRRARIRIPWKLIVLLSVCGFAYEQRCACEHV